MKRIELMVTRLIPAAPGDVYDVWTDAKSPGGPWFGCERVILNPVVDGLFFHSVQHEGKVWAHYGRFVRLERGRVIEHTWMSEATGGVETTVTVTFEPKGKDTQITLRHTDVPDDEMGRRHEEGWTYMLGAIADRFGARK